MGELVFAPPKTAIPYVISILRLFYYLKGQNQEEKCLRIVDGPESDVEHKKISAQSPIAKAMLGKKVDDTAIVHLPKETKEYVMVDISYTHPT